MSIDRSGPPQKSVFRRALSDSTRPQIALATSVVVHAALWLLFGLSKFDRELVVPLEVDFISLNDSAAVARSDNRARESQAQVPKPQRAVRPKLNENDPEPKQVVETPNTESDVAVLEKMKDQNLAAQPAEVSPSLGSVSSPMAGANDQLQGASETQNYLSELRRILEAKKQYPKMAQKLGHKGKVTVEIVLGKDGRVLEAKIIEKNSSELLNEATEKLIQSVTALKPFPEAVRKERWAVKVPIEYLL